MTMLPLPKGVMELLFDGDPAISSCMTFAVRVFPETEAVLVYASLDRCPVRCSGPLTYLTVTTNSGRIYVQRLSKYSHFEITIAAAIEQGAVNISLGAESSPPTPQGNHAPNGIHDTKWPRPLQKAIGRSAPARERG